MLVGAMPRRCRPARPAMPAETMTKNLFMDKTPLPFDAASLEHGAIA